MTEQRLAPTRQLTEVADCLEAMATGKGGWAWADVLDELRAIIDGPEVKPFAYYVYFPDAQDGEFCDDLDDLIDRMTNERHEVTPLFSAAQSAPVQKVPEATAQPSAVVCPEEVYWSDLRLAAYATDKEK